MRKTSMCPYYINAILLSARPCVRISNNHNSKLSKKFVRKSKRARNFQYNIYIFNGLAYFIKFKYKANMFNSNEKHPEKS